MILKKLGNMLLLVLLIREYKKLILVLEDLCLSLI
nr:MAG TPA: hypothetical protein [Caudoviricetes sp.]